MIKTALSVKNCNQSLSCVCLISGGAERVLQAWWTFLTDVLSMEPVLPLYQNGFHNPRGHPDPLGHRRPPHADRCLLQVSVHDVVSCYPTESFLHREPSSRVLIFVLILHPVFPQHALPSLQSQTAAARLSQRRPCGSLTPPLTLPLLSLFPLCPIGCPSPTPGLCHKGKTNTHAF